MIPIKHSERDGYIYLASPYSHEDPDVRQDRYEKAVKATYELLTRGFFIYSPIVHTHPLCVAHNPKEFSFEFWKDYDRVMIERSGGLAILTIEGWHISKGISSETQIALDLFKPIYYISPSELGL